MHLGRHTRTVNIGLAVVMVLLLVMSACSRTPGNPARATCTEPPGSEAEARRIAGLVGFGCTISDYATMRGAAESLGDAHPDTLAAACAWGVEAGAISERMRHHLLSGCADRHEMAVAQAALIGLRDHPDLCDRLRHCLVYQHLAVFAEQSPADPVQVFARLARAMPILSLFEASALVLDKGLAWRPYDAPYDKRGFAEYADALAHVAPGTIFAPDLSDQMTGIFRNLSLSDQMVVVARIMYRYEQADIHTENMAVFLDPEGTYTAWKQAIYRKVLYQYLDDAPGLDLEAAAADTACCRDATVWPEPLVFDEAARDAANKAWYELAIAWSLGEGDGQRDNEGATASIVPRRNQLPIRVSKAFGVLNEQGEFTSADSAANSGGSDSDARP
jgi:hypothetical protein